MEAVTDAEGVGAVCTRAVRLYAIGNYDAAFAHLSAVMSERTDALLAATGLATRIVEDPSGPAGWEITGLPLLRHRRAMPVVTHFLRLTRGKNYGGIHQIWDQLPPPLAGDVLATLLAMAGAAACHPEWN